MGQKPSDLPHSSGTASQVIDNQASEGNRTLVSAKMLKQLHDKSLQSFSNLARNFKFQFRP
jgi:hypothetical protein